MNTNNTMKLAKCNLRNQLYKSCLHQIHGVVLDMYHDILTSICYIIVSTLSEV